MRPTIRKSYTRRRYELRLGEELVGFIGYKVLSGAIMFTNMEMSPGPGDRTDILIGTALEDVRSMNMRAVARCEAVAEYMRRHPEYGDLLLSGRTGQTGKTSELGEDPAAA